MKSFHKNSLKRNRVLWKSFAINWKNYVVLFCSSMIMISIIFTFFSVKNMLDVFNSNVNVLTASYGISKIVMDGIIILGILSAFLMAFSLKYYVETRKRCYGVYKLLGMNGKLLNKLMLLEYSGTVVCSFVGGYLLGNFWYWICKQMILRQDFTDKVLPNPSFITYAMTFVFGVLILIFAFVIDREVAIETDMIKITTGGASEEKRPEKRTVIGIIIGIALIVFGLGMFSVLESAENLWYVLSVLAGVIFLYRYAGSMLLTIGKKRKKYYYRHLLSNQSLYYQFRTHTSYMIMLFLLQFVIIFYYPVQYLTNTPVEVPKEVYKSDFVWKMDSNNEKDVAFLEELEEKYKAECLQIPAVCVTSAKRQRIGDRTDNAYQGQNIGISASTYKQLTGKSLELTGDEICVFLQQGKEKVVHSLDYFGMGKKVFLHFGPAYAGANLNRPYAFFTDEFEVKSTKAEWIFGAYVNELNENVVVFSDEIFEELEQITSVEELLQYHIPGDKDFPFHYEDRWVKAYAETAGFVNRLVFIDAEEENHAAILEALEEVCRVDVKSDEAYFFDKEVKRYYSSAEEREDALAEKMYWNIVCILMLAVFVFAEIFIVILRCFSDYSKLQEYDQFYQMFGMDKRRRDKTIYTIMRLFIAVPTVTAVVVGMIFTYMTLRLRSFTGTEIADFMTDYLPMVGIFVAIQVVIYWGIKLSTKHRMAVK